MSIADKLQTIAEKMTDVFGKGKVLGFESGFGFGKQEGYNEGYEAGKAEGGGGDTEAAYQEGLTAGKQAENDSFWDSFQNYGNRRSYGHGFAHTVWTNRSFNPKYPIIATDDASYMFNKCRFNDIDFVEQGIVLDISGATSLTYLFRECTGIKRVGTLDCTGCKDLNRLFYNSSIKTIDELVVKEDTTYDNTFAGAAELENITITGKIGNKISFGGAALLAKESINSIVNALSDTANGKTVTFKQIAVNAAFTTDEWNALVATKPNWTVILA